MNTALGAHAPSLVAALQPLAVYPPLVHPTAPTRALNILLDRAHGMLTRGEFPGALECLLQARARWRADSAVGRDAEVYFLLCEGLLHACLAATAESTAAAAQLRRRAIFLYVAATDLAEGAQPPTADAAVPRLLLGAELFGLKDFRGATRCFRQAEAVARNAEGPGSVLALLSAYNVSACFVAMGQLASEYLAGTLAAVHTPQGLVQASVFAPDARRMRGLRRDGERTLCARLDAFARELDPAALTLPPRRTAHELLGGPDAAAVGAVLAAAGERLHPKTGESLVHGYSSVAAYEYMQASQRAAGGGAAGDVAGAAQLSQLSHRSTGRAVGAPDMSDAPDAPDASFGGREPAHLEASLDALPRAAPLHGEGRDEDSCEEPAYGVNFDIEEFARTFDADCLAGTVLELRTVSTALSGIVGHTHEYTNQCKRLMTIAEHLRNEFAAGARVGGSVDAQGRLDLESYGRHGQDNVGGDDAVAGALATLQHRLRYVAPVVVKPKLYGTAGTNKSKGAKKTKKGKKSKK